MLVLIYPLTDVQTEAGRRSKHTFITVLEIEGFFNKICRIYDEENAPELAFNLDRD